MPSYPQILKANGFINISVHGDAYRGESGSFDGDMVSEFGIRCLQIDDASLPGTTSHYQGANFSDVGQWVIQGRGGTNPVNNQHSRVKNKDSTEKTRKAVPDSTSAGAKNTVRTKNKGTVPLDMGGKKPVLSELHTERFNLDNWKCYLDICATYHTFFVMEFLDRVYSGKKATNGSCNTGTVTTNTRGWYNEFKVWLNKRGISNLLSTHMFEDTRYILSTHTKGDWVVSTPKVKKIVFKRDTVVCKGTP